MPYQIKKEKIAGFCFRFILCLACAGFLFLPLAEQAVAGTAGSGPESEGGGKILTDAVGRRVAVPVSVRRIACLYAFSGHVVGMLGRGGDIVAVSNGLKRDRLFTRMIPEIENAVVPKAQGAVNIEELLVAAPDIVFLAPETGKNTAELQKLETFKFPSLVVDFQSIDQQMEMIAMIGSAIGAEEKAKAYLSYFEHCIQRAEQIAKAAPDAKRIRVFHATTEENRTPAVKSLSGDWIRRAGLINVVEEAEDNAFLDQKKLELEQIYKLDPDVILVNEPRAVKRIFQDKAWSAIRAVQSGRVIQMPIGISRWGHPGSLETPLALLWAAKTLYPEQCPEIDLKKEVSEFYRTFFEYELKGPMIDKILEGRGMREPKNKKRNRKAS